MRVLVLGLLIGRGGESKFASPLFCYDYAFLLLVSMRKHTRQISPRIFLGYR